jgi:hypothetical protein
MGNFISKAWDDLTGKTAAKEAADKARDASNAGTTAQLSAIDKARQEYLDQIQQAGRSIDKGYSLGNIELAGGENKSIRALNTSSLNAQKTLADSGDRAGKTIGRGTSRAVSSLTGAGVQSRGDVTSGYDSGITRTEQALAAARAAQQPFNDASKSAATTGTLAWQRALGLVNDGVDPMAQLNNSAIVKYRQEKAAQDLARALRARGINDSGTGARLSAEAVDRINSDEADKLVRGFQDMAQFGMQGATRGSDLEMQGGQQVANLNVGKGNALADIGMNTGLRTANALQTGAQNQANVITDTGKGVADSITGTGKSMALIQQENAKNRAQNYVDQYKLQAGLNQDTGNNLAVMRGAMGQAQAGNMANQAQIAAAKANQPSTLDTLLKVGSFFF